jgi:hypothetical protein
VTDQRRVVLRSTEIGECDNADKPLIAVQCWQPANLMLGHYCNRLIADPFRHGATQPSGPRECATSSVGAPQPRQMFNTRSPSRGAAKSSGAFDEGAEMISVCAWRASPVRPPSPSQKAS